MRTSLLTWSSIAKYLPVLDILNLEYFKNIKMITYEIYDNFEKNFISLLNVNKCIDNNITYYEDSKIMIIKELVNSEKCKEIIDFIENNGCIILGSFILDEKIF